MSNAFRNRIRWRTGRCIRKIQSSTSGAEKIGGGHFQVIAGPCSIESKEQIIEVAEDVKKSGAGLLRGGAFKPRTSPYSFQGLQNNGLKLLLEAKAATGLPVGDGDHDAGTS